MSVEIESGRKEGAYAITANGFSFVTSEDRWVFVDPEGMAIVRDANEIEAALLNALLDLSRGSR